MVKKEVIISALSHSVTNSRSYAVVLSESDGHRRLPIKIGGFEAQAIAVAMEKMAPNRPLTHDLFKNTLDAFNIEVKEVVIDNLIDGIFYAKLVCLQDGNVYQVDARTSDAIAMAVRYNCPIFTYEFILEEAGVILDDTNEGESTEDSYDSDESSKTHVTVSVSDMSVDDLKVLLDKVLANEDYEKAAKIRDEINRREDFDSL